MYRRQELVTTFIWTTLH